MKEGQPYHQKRGDKNQELRREKDLHVQMFDENEEKLYLLIRMYTLQ
jgi:hypothetical protein